MNCTEFESKLADYLDGTLPAGEAAALEGHAAQCSSCREFLAEVNSGFQALKVAQPVEPPAELVTRLAYAAPAGKSRLPFEKQSLWSRFASRWLSPLLQPKLAMGMAMTILSFAMLERCTGIHVQHIQAADLNPVRIWSGIETRVLRSRDQLVKYYSNLKLVYEVESRLKELQTSQEARDKEQANKNSQPPQGRAATSSSDGTQQGER